MSPIFRWAGLGLWLCLLFTTLGVTANDFLTANLTVLAKIFDFSQSMAGATFMAFGNGAPDIFSTFTAINKGQGSLAISELIGAASFVTSVVLGMMILFAPPFKVPRRTFGRDFSFFVGAALFVLIIVADGKIEMWECITMVIYYLLYLLFLFIWGKVEENHGNKNRGLILPNTESTPFIMQGNYGTLLQSGSASGGGPSGERLEHLERRRLEGILGVEPDQRIQAEMALRRPALINAVQRQSKFIPASVASTSAAAILFPKLRNFWDQNHIGQCLSIAATPSTFFLITTTPLLRKSEVPHSESYAWNRWINALQCLTAPVFVAFVWFSDDSGLPFMAYVVCTIVSVVCLVTLFRYTTADKPPDSSWESPLSFAGFVVAMSWIYCVASEVVTFFAHVGIITKVSKAILGLTVFAIGNSIGDLFSNISLAQSQLPIMGVAACFGGPMLNLLLGISAGGLWKLLINGGMHASINIDITWTLVISAGTLLLTLGIFFCWVLWKRFELSKSIGVVLLSIWVVSTVMNCYFEWTGILGEFPAIQLMPNWANGALLLMGLLIVAINVWLIQTVTVFNWPVRSNSF